MFLKEDKNIAFFVAEFGFHFFDTALLGGANAGFRGGEIIHSLSLIYLMYYKAAVY